LRDVPALRGTFGGDGKLLVRSSLSDDGSAQPRDVRTWVAGLLAVLVAFPSVAAEGSTPLTSRKEYVMSFALHSGSFMADGMIPSRLTCEGQNISPQLSWTGLPPNTKSLALIVDDPDAPDPAAPRMTWVHWVLYNIPPGAANLPEGVAVKDLPPGSRQGLNDWQHTGYGGPCPPIGKHRYFHKLVALDVVLPDLQLPTKAALEKAMEGHVLARTELIGYYQRHR